MRDVVQQGDLPIKVVSLRSTMPHPEPGALGVCAHRVRQASIAHEGTEHDLPLLLAKQHWLSQHHPVAYADLTGFTPAARGADEMVASHRQTSVTTTRPPVGPVNFEVKELV